MYICGSNPEIQLVDPSNGDFIRLLKGHTKGIEDIGISRDGSLMVTCSWDSTAILRDIASGKKIRTFSEHAHTINSVDISGDGVCSVPFRYCDWTISLQSERRLLRVPGILWKVIITTGFWSFQWDIGEVWQGDSKVNVHLGK